jgi:hypothetical protein
VPTISTVFVVDSLDVVGHMRQIAGERSRILNADRLS